MKYKTWLNEWLRLYVKPTLKIRTYYKYESVIRLHIVPKLGDAEIEELGGNILQDFVLRESEKYSSGTVNLIITVVKKTLKDAAYLGYLKEESSQKIRRPKTRSKKIRCFSREEQRKIENAVLSSDNGRMYGVIICLYTGLRIGELLALEWSDVNFKRGVLSVNKSCHFGKDINGVYGRITNTPKTESSERLIPIPKALLKGLKVLKSNSSCKYVINYKEQPVKTRSYQTTYKALLKRAGVNYLGFHSLRHTFATRALESGMDVKTLAEIMGHKNPTVTLNRYAHSMAEYKAASMNRLCKYCEFKIL